MAEQLVGHVTHYFDHISVAVIKLTDGELAVGDQIHITGKNDFTQTVASMQLDHAAVQTAAKDSEIAIKVDQPVKPKDQIVKVTA
jgi:hypothetical protein